MGRGGRTGVDGGKKGAAATDRRLKESGSHVNRILHIHPQGEERVKLIRSRYFVFTFNPRSKLSFSIFVFTNFGMSYFWKTL